VADWPDEVSQLEALGLDRFAVLGISGGSPYAAVCAWKLPQRLTGAGIVSGIGPLDAPGASEGMSRKTGCCSGWLAACRCCHASSWQRGVAPRNAAPDRVLERASVAAVDRVAWQQVREVFKASLSEAFRGGGRGPAWELRLYARPWGFRLQDIQLPVQLWHGEQDANAPVAMGRHLAAAIPDCRASFYPEEGHLHFVDRLPEILRAL
jgi:pimeloyl-ACP methyl ester carboxylesterase